MSASASFSRAQRSTSSCRCTRGWSSRMWGVAAMTSVPSATAAWASAIAPSRSPGPSSMPGRMWLCRSITERRILVAAHGVSRLGAGGSKRLYSGASWPRPPRTPTTGNAPQPGPPDSLGDPSRQRSGAVPADPAQPPLGLPDHADRRPGSGGGADRWCAESEYEATTTLLLRPAVGTDTRPGRQRSCGQHQQRPAGSAFGRRGGGPPAGRVRRATSRTPSRSIPRSNSDLVDIKATGDSEDQATRRANAYAAAYIAARRRRERAQPGPPDPSARLPPSAGSTTAARAGRPPQLRRQRADLAFQRSVEAGRAEVAQPAQSAEDRARERPGAQHPARASWSAPSWAFCWPICSSGWTVASRASRSWRRSTSCRSWPGSRAAAPSPNAAAAVATRRSARRSASPRRPRPSGRCAPTCATSTWTRRPSRSWSSAPCRATASRRSPATWPSRWRRWATAWCLVDADLRKQDSGVPPAEDGLSLVLAGFELDQALTEVPITFDAVSQESRMLVEMPSGPLPPNPSELLESARMRWVIGQLERAVRLRDHRQPGAHDRVRRPLARAPGLGRAGGRRLRAHHPPRRRGAAQAARASSMPARWAWWPTSSRRRRATTTTTTTRRRAAPSRRRSG